MSEARDVGPWAPLIGIVGKCEIATPQPMMGDIVTIAKANKIDCKFCVHFQGPCDLYPQWDAPTEIYACVGFEERIEQMIALIRKPGTCCPEPTCDNRKVEQCEGCGHLCTECERGQL